MKNMVVQRRETLEDAERWFSSWPYFFSHAVLYFVMSLFFFLNVLPTGYASFNGLQPGFLMITVFYWSLFSPRTLPFSLVFALGLLFDLVTGFPMALTAMLLVGMQWLVRGQRRFLLGQPFIVLWLSFSMMCAVVFILQWAMFCFFFWESLSFIPVLTNTVLTVFLFPFIVVLFHKIRHMIANGQQDLLQYE